MSLYIDMKMILSMKCSGSHCESVIRLWIFLIRPKVVIPGNIFHSISVGIFIDSIHLFEVIVFRIPFKFCSSRSRKRSSPMFTQSTESEETWTLALVIWSAFSLNKLCRHPRGIFDTKSASHQWFLVVHWSVFQFHGITVPHCSKDYSSRVVNSPHSLVQDELLLEEWHSEICHK